MTQAPQISADALSDILQMQGMFPPEPFLDVCLDDLVGDKLPAPARTSRPLALPNRLLPNQFMFNLHLRVDPGPRHRFCHFEFFLAPLFIMAPYWRHNTFVSNFVSEEKVRQNLRLDPDVWSAIDSDRSKRPGSISRNTWITEAILDKLARQPSTDQKPRTRNA